MVTRALTAKQRRFVEEYLVDLNATQAAIRAGYSAKTAGSYGNENLKKPAIQSAIQDALQKQQERTEITADRVLKEIFRLATFDPRKLFNADGTVKNIAALDDDTAACVGGLDIVTTTNGDVTRKVKVWDKNSALEKLGKHFQMFTDKSTLEITNTTPQVNLILEYNDKESESREITGQTKPGV